MPDDRGAPNDRPAALLRALAGAWHVAAGFVFLIKRPGLWPLAILPAALALAGITGGFVLGLFLIPRAEALLQPAGSRLPDWLAFVSTVLVGVSTVVAGTITGLAVALLLSAPVLERLSRRVERQARGVAQEADRGLRWEIAQSLRGSVYFLAAAPLVFLLGLIPLAGPVLGALWGAYVLAFQQTDAPLSRRGLDFRSRRGWHRRWRAESLGFGLAGLLTLLVPFANVLVGPALAAGAALLVLELEEEAAGDQERT